ncbi:MAG: type II toxin-antitoxin system HicA family toxin [Fidelibacterota bacterium]
MKPKDFRYSEVKKLLNYFNYSEVKKGKTSGSRVSFVENDTKHVIGLHKPHTSGAAVPRYELDQIEQALLDQKKLIPDK